MNHRSGFVVDGHARVALALTRGEATVPVLYVHLGEMLIEVEFDATLGHTGLSRGALCRTRWPTPMVLERPVDVPVRAPATVRGV